jgi:hypothetical protein
MRRTERSERDRPVSAGNKPAPPCPEAPDQFETWGGLLDLPGVACACLFGADRASLARQYGGTAPVRW